MSQQRAAVSKPVRQFAFVKADETTDAMNALVNDVNAFFSPFATFTATTISFVSHTTAFLVANPGLEGEVAFATDGLKVGEMPGAGTGVPVYYSNTSWRTFSEDSPVAS